LSDEIESVRKEEERRGRRPTDAEILRARRRLLAALKEIFENGTLDDLEATMRYLGISPGSPQWDQAVQTWHDERAPR
jgi:hypothetical protein